MTAARVTTAAVTATILLLAVTAPGFAWGVNRNGVPPQGLKKNGKQNVTCLLVFGDSTVDPGNNNRLAAAPKANFPPYGRNFLTGRPTGRFSDGRLATDFIEEALSNRSLLRGFLDPTIEKVDLLHGVSFASAGSGYDELTANITGALSLPKQLEYFRHYIIHLRKLVGEKMAKNIIKNAVFAISMGSNDFIQNYFVDVTRSKQFTVTQYHNFLISRLLRAVKGMHDLGARQLLVVGVPPFGCLPIVKTLMDKTGCVEEYNRVAFAFNSQLKKKVAGFGASLGMKNAFGDIYTVIESAIQNPNKYGFKDTSKGCCGTGSMEYGDTCKGLNTCSDPTKYVFWDAVHPTQKMYKILANEVLKSVFDSGLM